jgi:dinuclear metal center YbgI/SA1388 family protein
VKLSDLTTYLDHYLRIAEVPDYPNALNGLQVDGPDEVERLAVAVDACQATIDAAVECKAGLLIVHHGLFWKGVEPVTGPHGRRLRALLAGNLAVYAAHIPLDVHPDVGNNAVLANQLGLIDVARFGDYQGEPVGVVGDLTLDRAALVNRIATTLNVTPHVIGTGPDRTARVGIVTGGAGSMITAAHASGVDTFITGEGSHHTHFDAEELGMNVIYAGHYATETVGVKALAAHIAERFALPWEFLDHPTGL